jgi:hypothetical protein
MGFRAENGRIWQLAVSDLIYVEFEDRKMYPGRIIKRDKDPGFFQVPYVHARSVHLQRGAAHLRRSDFTMEIPARSIFATTDGASLVRYT